MQACFDELKHSAVIAEVRKRVTDRRVLSLVDRFLKAGTLSAAGKIRESDTGTPQGGNISPYWPPASLLPEADTRSVTRQLSCFRSSTGVSASDPHT